MLRNGGRKNVAELKKELETVMEAIMKDDDDDDDDDDDCDLDLTDIAIQTLSALKGLNLKQIDREVFDWNNHDCRQVPQEFKCPISGNLMEDPVVAASGRTYEEVSIQKWLKDGNGRCPQSDELLPHTVLIPNHSIKNLIMNWCKTNGVDVPRSSFMSDEECGLNDSEEHLVELLERLSSSSVFDQSSALKELRLLTTRLPSVRAHFGEIKDAIPRLFTTFLIERSYSDPTLHNDLVVTVLNISTHESNKRKIVSGSPLAISFLTDSLGSNCIETRSHAAAALSALSTLDSNKSVIGRSGAVGPLIRLIEDGHPLALKDAALAILNLCSVIHNRERAVFEGAVMAIMDKVIARVLINEMLEILAMLCSHGRAIEEMEEHGMLFCLFDILREEDVSEESKEYCVAIVYAMCFSDRTKLRKINEVENAYETLCRVASSGTSRAKRKATGLLQRLNRFAFISHTA